MASIPLILIIIYLILKIYDGILVQSDILLFKLTF